MFKTYVKLRISVQTRYIGNSNALIKMAESLCIQSFVCNHPGSDLLLNISLSVSQLQADKSLALRFRDLSTFNNRPPASDQQSIS